MGSDKVRMHLRLELHRVALQRQCSVEFQNIVVMKSMSKTLKRDFGMSASFLGRHSPASQAARGTRMWPYNTLRWSDDMARGAGGSPDDDLITRKKNLDQC